MKSFTKSRARCQKYPVAVFTPWQRVYGIPTSALRARWNEGIVTAEPETRESPRMRVKGVGKLARESSGVPEQFSLRR